MSRKHPGPSGEAPVRILALDLEGTLISNAASRFPRPGLFALLEAVKGLFEEVVLFTAVRPQLAREILTNLGQIAPAALRIAATGV